MKIIISSLFLFSLLFQPEVVVAQTQGCPDPSRDVCADLKDLDTQRCTAAELMRLYSACTNIEVGLSDIDDPFPVVLGRIIRGLLGFLGVIFLILIMYGGILWMTSAGNEERISKAKKILANSAIGLFIIVVSFALATFIFDVIIKAANPAP